MNPLTKSIFIETLEELNQCSNLFNKDIAVSGKLINIKCACLWRTFISLFCSYYSHQNIKKRLFLHIKQKLSITETQTDQKATVEQRIVNTIQNMKVSSSTNLSKPPSTSTGILGINPDTNVSSQAAVTSVSLAIPSSNTLPNTPTLSQTLPATDLPTEHSPSVVEFPSYVSSLVNGGHSLLNDMRFKTEFPHLGECSCKSPLLRVALEKEVIRRLQVSFLDKHQELTLVSVGSGQCFQELIYLAKLVNIGYKNIRLVLIDKDPNVKPSVDDLIRFKDTYLQNSKIEIDQFDTLENYQKRASGQINLQPNLLLLLDLEGDKDANRQPPHLFIYAYEFLNNAALIQNGATIAYTRPTRYYVPATASFESVAPGVCGRYLSGTSTLRALTDRTELA